MASTGRSSEGGGAGASGRAPPRGPQASAASGGVPPSPGISAVATGPKAPAQPTRSRPQLLASASAELVVGGHVHQASIAALPELQAVVRSTRIDRPRYRARTGQARPHRRVRRRASTCTRATPRHSRSSRLPGTVPPSPRSGAALFPAGRVPRHGTGARGAEGPTRQAHRPSPSGDVLVWDMTVWMPPGGAPTRAAQLATLEEIVHEYEVDDRFGELFEALEPYAASLPADADDACLVRVASATGRRRAASLPSSPPSSRWSQPSPTKRG